MADISKIKIGSTTHIFKDAALTTVVNNLDTSLATSLCNLGDQPELTTTELNNIFSNN